MPDRRSLEEAHLVNVLGAFVTSLGDELTGALEDTVGASGAVPAALLALDTWKGVSIEFLYRVLGITQSGTVRLVARLHDAGLVERLPGQDRRAVALHLTRDGRDLARRARKAREDILRKTLDPLTAAEKQLLAGAIDKTLRVEARTRNQARHACRFCEHSVCRDEACPIGSSVPVN